MERRGAPPDLRAGLTQTLRMVQVVWLVQVLLVMAALLLVPRLASPLRVAGGMGEVIALLFYAIGLADIVFGWWFRERAFAGARAAANRTAEEALGRIAGPALAAVTLALTPAILGIVLYLAFGNRTGLNVLCVLSLIGLALHRPRPDQWQEIVIGAGGHAHRPA